MKSLLPTLLVVAFAAGSLAARDQVPAGAGSEAVDSGRYTVDASCASEADATVCVVTVRDLVYDTLLLEHSLSTVPESPGASTSRSVTIETNPAQGNPQQLTVALGPQERGTAPDLVRLVVETKEGEHVVQHYAVAFPVVGGK